MGAAPVAVDRRTGRRRNASADGWIDIMLISEVFLSIQGEGKLAGLPSAFIRTSGCNLRCTWCDTPYTSWAPEGEGRGVENILEEIAKFRTRFVVVTGGEPMIAPDIAALCAALRCAGYHITVETAATVFKPVACDLASLSPKLSNSTPWKRDAGRYAEAHERTRINIEVIRAFMSSAGDYQIKFVVDRPEDIDEVDTLIAATGNVAAENVLLMPQGTTRQELAERGPWIADLCKSRGYRYCPRLHIDLYGARRGT